MIEYKVEKEIREIKTASKIICDTCYEKVEKDIYFEVTTGHALWGNDSIDSVVHYQFCSYPCMKKHMDEYFEKPERTYVYDIEVEKTPK